MRPLSRSNTRPLDDTYNAEVISKMKGRRAINQYVQSEDELEWDEYGLGRVHYTCDPENRPHPKGRYTNL